MRLSAFILSQLVLLMVFAPCKDHRSFVSRTSGTPSLYAVTQHEGQMDDDCSPLCTCSCCASVTVQFYFPAIEAIAPVLAVKPYPVYSTSFYSADRSAVWQPPRIG